jgi:hypothetical protein
MREYEASLFWLRGCAGSGEEEEQCAVCRMEFEPGEDLRRLPCSHMYHPACIGQWLHINKVLVLLAAGPCSAAAGLLVHVSRAHASQATCGGLGSPWEGKSVL